jgi:uncharacterized protein YggE
MTLKVDGKQVLQIVNTLLLVAILGLVLWSQPWSASTSAEVKKISVSGEATIEAEPDEYLFGPYFEVKSSDEQEARARISKLSNDAVDALKELGVDESDISLDASSYDRWYWEEGEEGVVNAYLQITVQDKELAQKVQDYLTNSEAKGQLTSSESFSTEKQEELDAQATELAIEDARMNAETQAKLIGAELGEVIEVKVNESYSAFPFAAQLDTAIAEESQRVSLPVLPGEQEFTKSIDVVFEIK